MLDVDDNLTFVEAEGDLSDQPGNLEAEDLGV